MKKESELFEAINTGNVPRCLDLIDQADIDLNCQYQDGYTPLHFASQRKLVSVVRRLLELGVDVNQTDGWGNTALVRALGNSNENREIVDLLLKAGVDPKIENHYGNSVLSHVAKLKQHPNRDQFSEYLEPSS